MELARKDEKTQLTPVEKVLQNDIVRTLAVKKFDQVAANLPKRIQGTFNIPKIREMILASGEKTVQGFIEFELIKLAERINASGNLTDSQIEFIAGQILSMYPNETIADFKLCFEGIALGKYIKQDKLFKLDGTEIGYAIGQYLDEKYQVMEAELAKEKDNPYDYPRQPQVAYKRIDDLPLSFSPVKNKEARKRLWERSFYAMSQMKGRHIPKISSEEILEEGRLKPKYQSHPYTPPGYQAQIDAKVRKGRELYFRENYPGATEEQVNEYLDSFEN